MQVLLLNASPKNYGATEEILETIKNKISDDYTVKSLCLGDLNIGYCKGCKICYETGECFQKDDENIVINIMNESDIMVIAAPSYWADIPGQFKVFIDRCTAYSNTNPNPNHMSLKCGKKCYAIALRTGIRTMECEHIIESINHWCGHMDIEMAGNMYFCGINDKADIVKYKDKIDENCIEWFKL